MQIKDSIVLITQAGTLLGSHIAEQFASLGAKLLIADGDETRLAHVYQHCSYYSDSVFCITESGNTLASTHRLMNKVETDFNRAPDIMINVYDLPPFPNMADDNAIPLFSENINVITTTCFTHVKLAAQRMQQEHRQGVIINVLQAEEYIECMQGASILASFTRHWAKELAPHNIRVAAIIPSATHTTLTLREIDEEIVRNTEYIVANDSFSGRVMNA